MERIKLLIKLLTWIKTLNKKVGKILIHDRELHVYSKDSIMNCTLIQLENKRVMSAKDLINGLKLDENSLVYWLN